MDPREFARGAVVTAITLPAIAATNSVRINLTLDVLNPQALWDAAYAEGISAPGATSHDVIETIGPREDPVFVDCLAMLLRPSTPPGCAVEHCTMEAVEGEFGGLPGMPGLFPPAAWMAT